MESVDYRGAYLICGPEKYGMEQKCVQLEKRYIKPEVKAINYDVAQEDIGEILSKANTLPFMNERRMVVVKDAGLLASDPNIDRFLKEVFEIPETTLLLLMETSTPIKKNQKLYKRFKDRGRIIAMERLSGRVLRNYLAAYLEGRGRKIKPQALEHFIRLSGYSDRQYDGDLQGLITALDQIISITTDEVDIKAVDTFLDPFQTETIFDLLDAISYKKADRVLSLIQEFDAKEEPVARIVFMIARQTRNLLFYQTMKKSHQNDGEIFKYMGIKPYEGKKIAAQSRLFTRDRLKRQYDLLIDCELAMKTTGASGREVLETLVLKMLREQ